MSNIVHQYFKKELEGATILLQMNPIQRIGIELTVPSVGKPESREIEFGENILVELKENGFEEAGAMEFNLYSSGLL